jgi:hypothetical protein
MVFLGNVRLMGDKVVELYPDDELVSPGVLTAIESQFGVAYLGFEHLCSVSVKYGEKAVLEIVTEPAIPYCDLDTAQSILDLLKDFNWEERYHEMVRETVSEVLPEGEIEKFNNRNDLVLQGEFEQRLRPILQAKIEESGLPITVKCGPAFDFTPDCSVTREGHSCYWLLNPERRKR